MQPLRRFNLDAAIIFSDILVIPEALGHPYSFGEHGGIRMEKTVDSAADITALTVEKIPSHLDYVAQALRLSRKELGETKALLGFCGAPWTLATYMVEGGSSKSFSKIKSLFYTEPKLYDTLLSTLADAAAKYLKSQIDAGVDAVQLFDSWAGALSERNYWDFSGKYIQQIVQKLSSDVPIILYAKGAHGYKQSLQKMNFQVLSVDWTTELSTVFDNYSGAFAVQGNMDPALMGTTPAVVEKEARRIIADFGTRQSMIFNLGHGIFPDARIECMHALVETVTHL